MALIDGIWHQATNYTNVEFDGNPRAASAVRLQEVIDGGPTNPFGAADFFFQNLTLGVEETLQSAGLNGDWQMRDDLKGTSINRIHICFPSHCCRKTAYPV